MYISEAPTLSDFSCNHLWEGIRGVTLLDFLRVHKRGVGHFGKKSCIYALGRKVMAGCEILTIKT